MKDIPLRGDSQQEHSNAPSLASDNSSAYHRNGVGGCGFDVSTDSTVVTIKFYGRPKHAFLLSSISPIVNEPLSGPKSVEMYRANPYQVRGSIEQGGCKIVVFDDLKESLTFVGFYDPECPDIGFAVLQWDRLMAGDVGFGTNSWRGDAFFDALKSIGALSDARAEA